MNTDWRKLLPAFAIGAAVSAGIVALLVFSRGDDEPSPVQQGAAASEIEGGSSSSAAGGAGEGPRWIWPPKRLTEGDWVPPAASVKVTADLPPPSPKHVGEVINGIRIVDPAAPAAISADTCSVPVQRSSIPFPLEVTYLPPNTFAAIEPEVLVCPDDGTITATVHYQIGAPGALASFTIVYGASAAALAYGNGEVAPIEINGLKGVTVAAQTQRGVETGFSRVTLKTPGGILEVGGSRMPLDELVKIAQGVRCSVC